MSDPISRSFYNVLLEERVAIGAARTQAFASAPPGTKYVRWTTQSGAKVVYRLDGSTTYPTGITDGHESYGDDWRMGDTDALKVYMLDYAGVGCYIFVTYLGGRLQEADL